VAALLLDTPGFAGGGEGVLQCCGMRPKRGDDWTTGVCNSVFLSLACNRPAPALIGNVCQLNVSGGVEVGTSSQQNPVHRRATPAMRRAPETTASDDGLVALQICSTRHTLNTSGMIRTAHQALRKKVRANILAVNASEARSSSQQQEPGAEVDALAAGMLLLPGTSPSAAFWTSRSRLDRCRTPRLSASLLCRRCILSLPAAELQAVHCC
jgi:hypothetical protein